LSKMVQLKDTDSDVFPMIGNWKKLYDSTPTKTITLSGNVEDFKMLAFFIGNSSTGTGTPIIIPVLKKWGPILRGSGTNFISNQLEILACRGSYSGKTITITDLGYVYLKSNGTLTYNNSDYTGITALYGLR